MDEVQQKVETTTKMEDSGLLQTLAEEAIDIAVDLIAEALDS